jgi:hypothetical protein
MKPLRKLTILSQRALLAGFVLFLLLGVALAAASRLGTRVAQPVRFNHALHIENGLACTDCHQGAEDAARATLPRAEICSMCHHEAMGESAEEAKLVRFLSAGQEVPWVPITQLLPDVFFSHRRHVQLAGVACSDCHGAKEEVTAPRSRPFIQFTMDACLDCHRQRQAGTECNDCHR